MGKKKPFLQDRPTIFLKDISDRSILTTWIEDFMLYRLNGSCTLAICSAIWLLVTARMRTSSTCWTFLYDRFLRSAKLLIQRNDGTIFLKPICSCSASVLYTRCICILEADTYSLQRRLWCNVSTKKFYFPHSNALHQQWILIDIPPFFSDARRIVSWNVASTYQRGSASHSF